MKTRLTVMLGFTFLASSALAETISVPARANPWLAGMTNSATARRGDIAPDESPVPITEAAIEGGATYVFSATGLANHGATLPVFPPDGEDLTSHYLGAENGIADIAAPFVSLIGVFLGPDQPDQKPAPSPLDFTTAEARDYLELAPALKQPFFIGDGLTSSGAVQQVIAPIGATRLFLGVMDQYQWSDNEGAFSVEITKAEAESPSPPPKEERAGERRPLYRVSPNSMAMAGETSSSSGPELHAFTAIELSWPSEGNRLYQVQWTPSLDAPLWTNFGPAVPGSGANLSVFDSTRTHAQGFYRVQMIVR